MNDHPEDLDPAAPPPEPAPHAPLKPKRKRKAKAEPVVTDDSAATSGTESAGFRVPGSGFREGTESEAVGESDAAVDQEEVGNRDPESGIRDGVESDAESESDAALESASSSPGESESEANAESDSDSTEEVTAESESGSPEGAEEGSPGREPWDPDASGEPSPGGATQENALESDAAAAESPAPPVDLEVLGRTIEALLFAAEEPLTAREIARCAGSDSPTVRKALKLLREKYAQEQRAWDLLEIANGYRLITRAEFHPAIQKLKTQTAQRKLTQAALETLALIAYRQPIGRAEIESVRGVGAGPVVRQLLEKKLIQITGRGTGLGQPLQYGTTNYFLEHFGLKSIEELPKPGEFKNA